MARARRSSPDDGSILVAGPWTHRTVRANGIALHVAEIGSGPLVLLIHGFPQFWWAWSRQLVDLADAGFRAVAVDLRGYGASDKPPRGYDLPTLAADVAGLVTALGEQQAMLVGHDVGGLVAWSVAAHEPGTVTRIAVLGAPHPLSLRHAVGRHPLTQGRASAYALSTFQLPRRPEALLTRDSVFVRSLFDGWSGPGWQRSPRYRADVERYAEAFRVRPTAHCALEFFRWAVRSLPRPDGRRAAAGMQRPVTVPALQLHGALDSCTLPDTARGSGQHVDADYQWHLLEGVGHFPHNEVPERVSAELVDWAKLG